MIAEAVVPRVTVRAVWGTTIRIEICDAVPASVLEPVWRWFERVDELFSTWRDDSEITRLSRGQLGLADTSHEVRFVLDACHRLKEESGGAFDVEFAASRPDGPGCRAIDPTGLVKGWAVDRAAEMLAGPGGATNFSINAGGDILVRGRPRADAPWRVGIQHPWQRDKTAMVLGVTDAAVATSGAYERGDHVIDPRTGHAARGLASVTVVACDLATADGYATAALTLGADGMEWLAGLPEVVAVGITDAQRVVKTAGTDDLVLN